MKKVLMLAAAAVLVTLLPGAARADDKAVRGEVQALYAKLIAAMKAKSVSGVMNLGTPDFSMKDHKTLMDTAHVKAGLQSAFKSIIKVDKFSVQILRVTTSGDTITSFASYEMLATTGGADHKTHRLVESESNRDVIVRTPKGLKFKVVQTDVSRVTMDGQPVAMAGGPPRKR